ncbi:MAG: secretin N-terminal domain-containing protein [Phycisphaerae bacterium]
MKTPKKVKFLTVFAFVIAACSLTFAGDSNEPSKQRDVSGTVTMSGANSSIVGDSDNISTTLQERMLKKISVDFTNTPIEDVIKMIAEQADVDIIKSPGVTGNVTAKLTNVPMAEALDNILAVSGYGCVIDKNLIRISLISEIAQKEEILQTRVYQITYADVVEVEKALKKFLSKRGSLSSSPATSNIIVKDTESNIKAMDSFIAKIDRMTTQVLVEVRIYDVTSTDGFNLGTDWSIGRNNPITVLSTNTQADNSVINNLTGVTTPDTTTFNTTKTTQTAWQDNTAGGVTGTSSYLYRKSNPFVGGAFSSDSAGSIRLGFLDAINAEVTLNILRSEVGAKLLANPRILVLDNETAEFKIISEIPYTEQSETSAGGAMTSIKFKEVGVELKVTPHITRDDMVRLHIVPEFSVVTTPGTTLATGYQTVPTIDKRRIDTIALVRDGQTVVLGGLRKRTVSQDVTKIPILGDIPLFGRAFTSSEESVETNELIIFITPRVVVEPLLSSDENKGLGETEFGGPRISYTEDEKAEMAGK